MAKRNREKTQLKLIKPNGAKRVSKSGVIREFQVKKGPNPSGTEGQSQND